MLSDVLAAILDAQLDKLAEIQARRAAVVARYREGLAGWAAARGVRLPPELPERGRRTTTSSSCSTRTARRRDAALRSLRAQGVMATFHYVPLHSSPHGATARGRRSSCR